MAEDTRCARLELLLGELKMPSMRRSFAKVATQVAEAGGDCIAYLCALAEEELEDRKERRAQRRLAEARFPQLELLQDLDTSALPKSVPIGLLHELAAGAYLDEARNVIAIGGSGTGKTHVSIALGVAACWQGRRVRFFAAAELASELSQAQEQHQLHRYLQRFARFDLVIIDELGYLPLSERGAELLFQALSARHERASVIVNTNLPFSEWTQVFRTERLAVALLDRLTHRARILEMNGPSYRLRTAKRGHAKEHESTAPAAS